MGNVRFDISMPILKSKSRAIKSPTTKQNKQGTPTTPVKVKKSRKMPQNDFPFFVANSPSLVEISIPVKTVSEANNFDHWTKKQARHNKQKWWVSLAFSQCEVKLPCTVKMCRCATKFLDEEDNLRMSLKWIKDYIAAEITQDFCPGRADGNKKIKWEYDQIKSKAYGVKITIRNENHV